MKLPRHLKYLAGPVDPVSFFAVFAVLVVIIALQNTIFPLRGLPIESAPLNLARLPAVEGNWLAIGIDQDGRIYLDNQIINYTNLYFALSEKLKQNQNKLSVLIIADRRVSYEYIIKVFQIALEAGISNVYLTSRTSPVYSSKEFQK